MTTRIHLFDKDPNTQSFAAGTPIFRAGDAGSDMYVIRDGSVVISRGDVVLNTLTAGDVFGEMALIDGSPRSADATAGTDCLIVPVNAERFDRMVQITPHFARTIMKVL
ncbi:MAG: cyclic nucleotide-binding domain-containing protein, partial [Anaerolineae bacterium]|nr:cyclic nucleotide-binding domain-containing protein [Anaerolineae bacterium]